MQAPVPMLLSINRRVPGVMVGNFRYVESQMQLGQLAGNKFTLVLRGLGQADVAAAPAAATALAVSGFINYFGMQRFGTGIASTHRVGARLLPDVRCVVLISMANCHRLAEKYRTSCKTAAAHTCCCTQRQDFRHCVGGVLQGRRY